MLYYSFFLTKQDSIDEIKTLDLFDFLVQKPEGFLFVFGFSSHSRIFHYGDITIAGVGV